MAGNTVQVKIEGGPQFTVPWNQGMTARKAMEAAYNSSSNNPRVFTFEIQYFGSALGYLVVMINETFNTFPSLNNFSPYYFWLFSLNGKPADKGIDSITLKPGDVVSFAFTVYSASEHASFAPLEYIRGTKEKVPATV